MDLSDFATLTGSAALSGGILGGAGSFIGGVKDPRRLLKSALTGAGLSGTFVPASYLAGNAMLGSEEAGEVNSAMKRAGLGGLALGGVAGGALGALGATGKLQKLLARSPKAQQFVKNSELPTDNAIIDLIKKLQASKANPTLKALGGAGLGAGMVAPIAAFQGADEGQQLDTIRSQLRSMK
ncbi:hypothetical protein [Caudoviricetes sp.]|nr:hypothetical protein [Caudoviricetes sp.]